MLTKLTVTPTLSACMEQTTANPNPRTIPLLQDRQEVVGYTIHI